ncbi:MAG: hypothetical protein HY457_01650 [Parcubacteria group bacterium]|nr:hypothetical protein [Parcubacteria group bacterium]
MSAVKSYALARACVSPAEWEKFINDPNRWQLTVDGKQLPKGTDFALTSKFGEVRSAVVVGPDGKPSFDRPLYREAPFVQTVTWGLGADGRYYFGMVEQVRPHADMPGAEAYNVDGHKPVPFLHVIMGFSEKAATGKFETPEQAATREASEEGGASESAVVGVEVYPVGHNPSPSFTPTWGAVVAVQVNLRKLEKPIPDPEEPINGVYFIEVGRLLAMVRSGKSDTGAYTGVSTSLSALFIHLAHHPEQWPRAI